MAYSVNLTDVSISGSRIGNDNTGYKVPFAPAFAIIAAIIVDDTPRPIFPSMKVRRKRTKFLITNSSNNAEYSSEITVFIANTSTRLNKSFPLNTVEGDAISWRVKVVPLSSSDTNALDNPDIAEKNITTQNNPPASIAGMDSFPIENSITLIATIINIAREFIAYLVLISELKSFRKRE